MIEIAERYVCGNRLLDTLRLSDRETIARYARVVHFSSGDIIQEPKGAKAFVDFPIADFLTAIDDNRRFKQLIGRVAQAQRFFVEQQCACNAVHSVDQRCARWIMMIQDRVGRETFALTHEFLSVMLGVRRATVSKAAMKLQDAGIIRYCRGNVKVLSVPNLVDACCECYELTRNVFDSSLLDAEMALSELIAT